LGLEPGVEVTVSLADSQIRIKKEKEQAD
jgi:hypothetical protein